jgi:hypothetical protein
MVGGVNMAIAIGTTIMMITDQLGFEKIPTIIFTDSYSPMVSMDASSIWEPPRRITGPH